MSQTTKIFVGLFALLSVLMTSCTTPKNITYMQGLSHDEVQAVSFQKQITVRPGDQLSIIVSCEEPELAETFNLLYAQPRIGQGSANGGSRSSSNNGQTAAYTVDPNGDINFPVIGKMHIGGLTRAEVVEKVEKELINTKMLKSPVVTVEFLNASVYVLGDVSSPGEVPINKEGLNIMQALSLAGDLSITGQRENVLVVREEEGGNHAYRIDLTDKEGLVQSPVFYLQQNDVVYVEPNDMQKRNSKSNANTIITPSFWMSVVSFLTALGVLIF